MLLQCDYKDADKKAEDKKAAEDNHSQHGFFLLEQSVVKERNPWHWLEPQEASQLAPCSKGHYVNICCCTPMFDFIDIFENETIEEKMMPASLPVQMSAAPHIGDLQRDPFELCAL